MLSTSQTFLISGFCEKGAGRSSQVGAWPKQHPDSVASALGSDHTWWVPQICAALGRDYCHDPCCALGKSLGHGSQEWESWHPLDPGFPPFPFPSLSHVPYHILPHSWHARIKKQHGNVVWTASIPVPTRRLVHNCLVPSERGSLASAPQCHCCCMAPGPGSPGMDWAWLSRVPQCGKFLKKQLPLNHIFI